MIQFHFVLDDNCCVFSYGSIQVLVSFRGICLGPFSISKLYINSTSISKPVSRNQGLKKFLNYMFRALKMRHHIFQSIPFWCALISITT